MNIVMCDDERLFLNQLENTVKIYIDQKNIKANIIKSTDAIELKKNIQEIKPDLVFLDIDLPKVTGFELSKEIKILFPKCIIVFCTNHNELVYESFEYEPFWFLCKDEYNRKIEKIMDQALVKIKKEKQEFIICLKDKSLIVKYSEIMYIEVKKHKLQFHLRDNKIVEQRGSIAEIERQFEAYEFIRINSGCLVNLKYIQGIDKNIVVLENNESLIISRSNKKMVKDKFFDYIGNKVK